MHRKLSILSILLCLFMAPVTSHAIWWLFDDKNEWREMDPVEQDARAIKSYNKATEAYKKQKESRALKHYKRVWQRYPGSQFASESLYQYSQILHKKQEWRDAYNSYFRLLRFYPDNPHFNDIIESLFDIASAHEEGRGVYYFWFFEMPHYEKAIMYYEDLITIAPYSDFAPIALMRIALIQNELGNEFEAIDALDRLINRFPNNLLTSDAYLNMAHTFALLVDGPEYDQGATTEAISFYEDFMILYQDNPAVIESESGLAEMQDVFARSKLIIGKFYYHRRDNFSAAKIFFNETITAAPDSPSALEAQDYLKKIALIEKFYPRGDWPRRNDLQHVFNPSFDLAEKLLDQ